MEDEVLRLDKQICFRLYKASRTMTRLYQPILESMKISYPQYVTMLVMWEEGTVDFKDLGKRLDLKTGTLTPIVKRLESLGYLHREKNTEDNRRVWVKITDKGMELKESALRVPGKLIKYINMDQEQYGNYIKVLYDLDNILTEAEKKQKEENKK